MSGLVETSTVLKNPVAQQLADLKIIDPANVELYYPRVQDREDVGVFRCMKSGVIFLSRSDHIGPEYYQQQKATSYCDAETEAAGLLHAKEDDMRRVNALKRLVADEKLTTPSYLDVGCGLGGVLRGMKEVLEDSSAIEPQDEIRESLKKSGYATYASFDDLPNGKKFDIVTLFHVFEHLKEPLAMLKDMYAVLKPGGILIIEVPHAKDALLRSFDLEAFKKFTFWSEHIILHTQQSLKTYLEAASFRDTHTSGIQRYPLANHLHWLWKGEPGGHQKLAAFRENTLEEAYEKRLVVLDQTDTLWVEARR